MIQLRYATVIYNIIYIYIHVYIRIHIYVTSYTKKRMFYCVIMFYYHPKATMDTTVRPEFLILWEISLLIPFPFLCKQEYNNGKGKHHLCFQSPALLVQSNSTALICIITVHNEGHQIYGRD